MISSTLCGFAGGRW